MNDSEQIDSEQTNTGASNDDRRVDVIAACAIVIILVLAALHQVVAKLVGLSAAGALVVGPRESRILEIPPLSVFGLHDKGRKPTGYT